MVTKIYLVEGCYGDSNKVYIGKTKSSRENKHKLRFGKGITYTLIDEIKSLDSKDWKPMECFWIEYFRYLGFNIQNKNEGGGGSSFHSNETILKISKPIIQYDLNGIFIKKWNGSVEASNHFGKKYSCSITDCCLGRQKTSCGFIWRYENDILNKDFILEYGDRKKPIIQYDINKNFIKVWESGLEASIFLGYKSSGNITRCCNGELKTAHTFIWRYVEDPLSPNWIYNNGRKGKKIIQYNLKGEIMREWDRLADAAKSLNKKSGSLISRCCTGKTKSAHGYIWKFKD